MFFCSSSANVSNSPRTINPYWRSVACRKSVTRQNTSSWLLSAIACCCACSHKAPVIRRPLVAAHPVHDRARQGVASRFQNTHPLRIHDSHHARSCYRCKNTPQAFLITIGFIKRRPDSAGPAFSCDKFRADPYHLRGGAKLLDISETFYLERGIVFFIFLILYGFVFLSIEITIAIAFLTKSVCH